MPRPRPIPLATALVVGGADEGRTVKPMLPVLAARLAFLLSPAALAAAGDDDWAKEKLMLLASPTAPPADCWKTVEKVIRVEVDVVEAPGGCVAMMAKGGVVVSHAVGRSPSSEHTAHRQRYYYGHGKAKAHLHMYLVRPLRLTTTMTTTTT